MQVTDPVRSPVLYTVRGGLLLSAFAKAQAVARFTIYRLLLLQFNFGAIKEFP